MGSLLTSNNVPAQTKKGGHPNIARCSPSLFHSFTQKVMTEEMRNKIEEMGFKGVLNIAARSLEDRDFLTWLMDCFNPEMMTIEINGGKKLRSLNTHSNVCLTCLLKVAILCSYLIPQRSKLSRMLQHVFFQMSPSRRV
jgi:hypothetical protein